MKYLYLSIDLLVVAIPLLFSFHPKIEFHKKWRAAFMAIALVAVLFLFFDSIFISKNVWKFNPEFITGVYVYNLPIEEILFFICIPYSCLFTFYCLNRFYDISINYYADKILCIGISLCLIIAGIIYRERLYTWTTFISSGLLFLYLRFALHVKWFGKAIVVYFILLLPFFFVNGILTGMGLSEPVVLYSEKANMNIRISTIPLEDFVYGFELFVLNLFFYLRFNSYTIFEFKIHKNQEWENECP